MSKKFRYASAISIAATLVTMLASTGGSGAKAQELQVPVAEAQGAAPIQTLSQAPAQSIQIPVPATAAPAIDTVADSEPAAASLANMVEETPLPASLSDEMNCLAGAVYFEAKGETLAGQLAVARVIVARSNSGRFPASYCGVVYQPSQFSFVRGHSMPAINKSSAAWANAVRVARIADNGSWKSPVEGAMFFHAASVSPRWGKTRMARIDNHVFYR